jgi:hypothetical protein
MASLGTGDLTSSIVNLATALSQQELKSQQSVAVLDKALDAQAQNALSLLASIPAAAPLQQSSAGQLLNVIA